MSEEKSRYNINLNHLCQTKFGASAKQVICSTVEELEDRKRMGKKINESFVPMGKSQNQLTRFYRGIFPTQKAHQQDYADAFGMPYYEFESYVKYGPHSEECPLGYAAAFLRKKFERELEPNYDILFAYLDITPEEWDDAINGRNEMCYYRADELEIYFDLWEGTLRGLVDEEWQTTHCFVEYPIEKAINEGMTMEEVKDELDLDKFLKAAIQKYENLAVLKVKGQEEIILMEKEDIEALIQSYRELHPTEEYSE